MRKVLISRSPLVMLILVVIAASAIMVPHSIETKSITDDCPVNTVCSQELEQTVKKTGLPFVWKTGNKTTGGEKDQNSHVSDQKRLLIDVGAWAALIFLVGLFPIKVETNENNRY